MRGWSPVRVACRCPLVVDHVLRGLGDGSTKARPGGSEHGSQARLGPGDLIAGGSRFESITEGQRQRLSTQLPGSDSIQSGFMKLFELLRAELLDLVQRVYSL